MGVSIFLETIDKDYQLEVLFMKRNDWKGLHSALFDYLYGTKVGIKYLTEYFGLELEPLKKIAQIEDIDPLTNPDFRNMEPEKIQKLLEEDLAEKKKLKEENEKMWQSPDDIITALTPFFKAVEAEPEVFLRLKEFKYSDPYLYDGGLLSDLEDLLKMCCFAKEHGILNVRIRQTW